MTPSYSLGLFFIFLVAVIWSLASIVVQYLYTDQHFDSPFLLTYIGTSLFIFLLPTRLVWERRRQAPCCSASTEQDEGNVIIPWKTRPDIAYEHLPTTSESISLEHVQIECTEEEHNQKVHDDMWSHIDHIRAAIKIAPVWFVANWAYNASLEYTSITSSTVLASTGSLFTFLFALLMKDEVFTTWKLLGVLLGVLGSVLTGLHDVNGTTGTHDTSFNTTASSTVAATTNATLCTTAGHVGTAHHYFFASFRNDKNDAAIWGDCLGLLSAVGYGAYAVMIRVQCPHDESKMSMQLLLGYIGLFNAILLSPIAIYVVPSSALTWVIFGYLVAKGMLDNVLSDYLWARAVVLTSATVATVGLGLTIPLAFVSDVILGHADNVVSVQSVVGALAVLVGFILVNVGDKHPEEEEDAVVVVHGEEGIEGDEHVE